MPTIKVGKQNQPRLRPAPTDNLLDLAGYPKNAAQTLGSRQVKIASWNVNSLKVRLPHLLDWLAAATARCRCACRN